MKTRKCLNLALAVFIGLSIVIYPVLVDADDTVTTSTVSLAAPTHFDDTWWNYPSGSGGYKNFSIDITPEANGSPDGYFFSTEFFFYNSGQAYNPSGIGFGYMGLQTEESSPINANGDIFSIWGSTAVSNSQYTSTFTEGQSGYSARNAYNWTPGVTYNLAVNYLTTNTSGEVWEATVTNTSSGNVSIIGDLTVPTSFGLLNGSAVSFHERFSGETISCSGMQLSDVEFTNPVFDNNVSSTSHTNYEPNVTDCSGYYGVEDIPDGIRTVIGGLPPTTTTPTTPVNTTAPTTTTPPATSSATLPPATVTPQAATIVTSSPGKIKAKVSLKPRNSNYKKISFVQVSTYTGVGLIVILAIYFLIAKIGFLNIRRRLSVRFASKPDVIPIGIRSSENTQVNPSFQDQTIITPTSPNPEQNIDQNPTKMN